MVVIGTCVNNYFTFTISLVDLSAKDRQKFLDTLAELKKQANEDPVFFIETFVKMYNPEEKPTEIPFKMFPFQKRLVRQINDAIANGDDIFIDKCRKMGVTYTILSVFLWRWLFVPGQTLYVGSRKEDYVDNRRGGVTGNKEESLFGKLDYILTRIERDAAFILPEGFNRTRHFTYMSLLNPENGNSISGESANPDFSRGSRKSAILLDEYAFWDHGSAVWGATADTTNCRIIATTPGHKPSKAKRLRFGQDKEKIKVITLTYDLDPRKSRKWLENERERRSTEDFNREIMVNWEVSITGRVYPEIENAAYGDFPFLVNQQLYCSWDLGLDGTAIQFWQINPANGKLRLIDSYTNEGQVIQFYFPVFGRPLDSKFIYTDDDLQAFRVLSQFPKAVHYGDADVNKKSFVKTTSTQAELNKIGIYVSTVTPNHFVERRDITKTYLAKGIEINDTPRNSFAFECFKMYRYPVREETSQATTPIVLPIHDFTSHNSTALEYLCLNYHKRKLSTQQPPSWAKRKKWRVSGMMKFLRGG